MTLDIESLDFEKGAGLIPVVVQDVCSGQVLMLGYMTRETLQETIAQGRVVFFSRSKNRAWLKGERSGNYLQVYSITADCDRDSLLIVARRDGPICHTGSVSCFAQETATFGFLGQLEKMIRLRKTQGDPNSYTAQLLTQGVSRVAQKVGEEAVEVVIAAHQSQQQELIGESADLLFHLLVLLQQKGISLTEVVAELVERHRAGHSEGSYDGHEA